MLSFQNLLESFEKKFQAEIQNIQKTAPVKLYGPIAYSLEVGGKRIRPVLLLHAASLFSSHPETYFPAAAAIELFHNFTLLHDDIMDHAAIRRGVQSVHVKYGENSAILSGDAMSIMSFRLLSQCEPEKLPSVLDLFSTTAIEVCEGQQYDMEFEVKDQVTISEYLEMIRLKTAVLIACSLKTGALLAGADEINCQLLYDFGLSIGIAFQLQDDWLDVYGEMRSFGKKIGGDICENKKTCLLISALEMSDEGDREKLLAWTEKSEFYEQEKIDAVRKIFSGSGAANATKELMKYYHDQGMEKLNQLAIADADKRELRKFASGLLSRVK
ncbi:MAG: polyprenyl synthetase family protein [Prolixibacteraceae bacterium]|jgi:geranylgeranyl diphosphate synthase type II|nr:polyprenyl synthetase family protein [Prolixibacteraceae bacterium]